MKRITALIFFFIGANSLIFADAPRIKLHNDKTTIDLIGLPRAALNAIAKSATTQAAFSVFVVSRSGKQAEMPILGNHKVDGDVLRFTPRFPLVPGVRYRAVWLPKILGMADSPIARDFTLEKPKSEPATVTRVYPSSSRLPENQLR
ncbi:MAG: hypothetical protein ACRD36_09780, partial [Candidatus Acidiferrum sp.]